MKFAVFIYLIISFVELNAQLNKATNAHSHNDYNNSQPLINALQSGAKSIEADIYYENYKFYVCHNIEDTSNCKTLETLYLIPLQKIIEDSSSEYRFNYELFLFIDIKSDANKTYSPLKKLLSNYQKYLSSINNGKLIQRQIRIILSGNRPIDSVQNDNYRFMFIDGRISDINKNKSDFLYPIISDSWENIIKIIDNPNTEIKMQNLENLIFTIHNENKIVRFWGISDNEEYWKLQLDYGVDLVNTDQPIRYKQFCANYNKGEK